MLYNQLEDIIVFDFGEAMDIVLKTVLYVCWRTIEHFIVFSDRESNNYTFINLINITVSNK
jgi:hypothetical protein